MHIPCCNMECIGVFKQQQNKTIFNITSLQLYRVNECHAVHFRGIDVLKHAATFKAVDILNHSATLWVSACTKRTLQPLQNEFCITRVACVRRVLCCERIGEQRHSVQQASYVQSD